MQFLCKMGSAPIRHQGRTITLDLVSPDNATSYALGTIAIEFMCRDADAHGQCTKFGELACASIFEAVLTPNRKHLIVTVSVTAGGHNLPIRFHRRSMTLPAGALPRP